MEKTRLPAGGRTAANIHPRQAEKDLERNSRSDGHACAGGKHALSMPEEPFRSARIISIARIRGTTVKGARAELPNGRNRSGTWPSSDNRLAARVDLGDRTLKLLRPARDLPPLSPSPPFASVTSHTPSEAAWPPSLRPLDRSYDAVGRFVGRRDGFVAVVRNLNVAENRPQEGKTACPPASLRRRLKSL
jgi:hypothetical protein